MPETAPPSRPSLVWSVYMLRDGTGRLYTGSSTEVARRLAERIAATLEDRP